MFRNTPSLCNYPNMTIKFVRFRAVTNKLLGYYFDMLIMRTACSPHTCNNRFLPLCRYQYSIHFPRTKKKKALWHDNLKGPESWNFDIWYIYINNYCPSYIIYLKTWVRKATSQIIFFYLMFIDCRQKYKEQYFSAAMLPSMACCLPTVER